MRNLTLPTLALLMLATVPASAQWTETVCNDPDWSGAKHWQGAVRHCHTIIQATSPDGKNGANLGYICASDGWHAITMHFRIRHGRASAAPELMLPIQWDEEEVTEHRVETKVLKSSHGTNYRWFHYIIPESAMPNALDAVARHDTVAMELPLTRIDPMTIRFQLEGATDAINATRDACALEP